MASKLTKLDPTRTLTLRNKFQTELRVRYLTLKGKIRRLVIDDDAFGLKQRRSRLTKNKRWKFDSNSQQVEKFVTWMRKESGLILPTGSSDQKYWEAFIQKGYEQGAGKAFTDVKNPLSNLDTKADFDFYNGTKSEFLRSAFASPASQDKLRQLTSRTFRDLVGTTEHMATLTSQVLMDGLARGQNPWTIARDLNKVVTKGLNSSLRIARTEIVRAHAEGSLDGLEKLGVDKVGVMVEWSTAGDDRVCQRCGDLEGAVLLIKEARGLIPRHPNCRCAFIPANVGEAHTGQIRTSPKLKKTLDDSIKSEVPAKGRTLAERRAASTWVGADLKPKSIRPSSIVTRKIPKGDPPPLPPEVVKPKKPVLPKPKPPKKPKIAKPKAVRPPDKPGKEFLKGNPSQQQEIENLLMELQGDSYGNMTLHGDLFFQEGEWRISAMGMEKALQAQGVFDVANATELMEMAYGFQGRSLFTQKFMLDELSSSLYDFKQGKFRKLRKGIPKTAHRGKNPTYQNLDDSIGIDQRIKDVAKKHNFAALRRKLKKEFDLPDYSQQIVDKSKKLSRLVKKRMNATGQELIDIRKKIAVLDEEIDEIYKSWSKHGQPKPPTTDLNIDPKLKDLLSVDPTESKKIRMQSRHGRNSTYPERTVDTIDRSPSYDIKLEEAADFIESIYKNPKPLDPRLDIEDFKLNERRSFHIDGGIYMAEEAPVKTFVHEIMHAVELNDKRMSKLAQEFLEMRIKRSGSKTIRMADICPDCEYGIEELGNLDSFLKLFKGNKNYAAYTGKSYRSGATEIMTMGIETLLLNPAHMAKVDPEFFDFLIAAMRGLI